MKHGSLVEAVPLCKGCGGTVEIRFSSAKLWNSS
jgi:hypothetical protein